ncbi:TBC1 domain protein [Histomonas meleagridis]|uniref:TBC1 domain protein n=1 Tax=Histomonas meleagridis TaxID=135588 RepID=UPI00355986EB|nr:TBC1 domain protein [Histomonas meleagridis]KAH0802428.1 TBC1 domain protein [Histomonas meleagridis]
MATPNMPNVIQRVIDPHNPTGEVNLELLIDLSKQGIPNNDQVSRFFFWELVLRIIPKDRSRWEYVVTSKSTLYWSWVEKYFSNFQDWIDLPIEKAEVKRKSFGLSSDDIMSEIHGDLTRMPNSQYLEFGFPLNEFSQHIRRIERILYIFSCLNSTYSYTQGFNEIVIPIYYVSMTANRLMGKNDNDGEFHAFYIFQNLIIGAGLGDIFLLTQNLDSIVSKFHLIETMCQIADGSLYKRLFKSDKPLVPAQFAFSWISLLFAQNFTLQNLLIVWDRILIKEFNVIEFAMAIAVAQLIESKQNLMNAKNSNKLLNDVQNIRDLDPPTILARAEDVWDQYNSSLQT